MSAPSPPTLALVLRLGFDAVASALGASLLGFFAYWLLIGGGSWFPGYPMGAALAALAILLAVRVAVASLRLILAISGLRSIDEKRYSALFGLALNRVLALNLLAITSEIAWTGLTSSAHSLEHYLWPVFVALCLLAVITGWDRRAPRGSSGPTRRRWF